MVARATPPSLSEELLNRSSDAPNVLPEFLRGLRMFLGQQGVIIVQLTCQSSIDARAVAVPRIELRRKLDVALSVLRTAEAQAKKQVEESSRRIAENQTTLIRVACEIAVGRWMRTQKFGETGYECWSPNAIEKVRFKSAPESWRIERIYAAVGIEFAYVDIAIVWRNGQSDSWSILLDSAESRNPKLLSIEPR